MSYYGPNDGDIQDDDCHSYGMTICESTGWEERFGYLLLPSFEPKTFSDAWLYCVSLDGSVFRPESDEENTYLSELWKASTSSVWAGVQCPRTDTTGCSESESWDLSYSNWEDGFPACADCEAATAGVCVTTGTSYSKWKDVDCSESHNFVCIRDLPPGWPKESNTPVSATPVTDGKARKARVGVSRDGSRKDAVDGLKACQKLCPTCKEACYSDYKDSLTTTDGSVVSDAFVELDVMKEINEEFIEKMKISRKSGEGRDCVADVEEDMDIMDVSGFKLKQMEKKGLGRSLYKEMKDCLGTRNIRWISGCPFLDSLDEMMKEGSLDGQKPSKNKVNKALKEAAKIAVQETECADGEDCDALLVDMLVKGTGKSKESFTKLELSKLKHEAARSSMTEAARVCGKGRRETESTWFTCDDTFDQFYRIRGKDPSGDEIHAKTEKEHLKSEVML